MSSTDYKNLSALINTLAEGITQLEKGELKPEQIELLLVDARSLHERLAVLQYLSFETELPPKKKKNKKKDKSVNLKFGNSDAKETTDNQINLLDAIEEEVEKTETTETTETQPPEKKINNEESLGLSINERFAHDESSSLADKWSKTPIKDLTKAIALNEKFLFINELFKGENSAYNSVVSELNQFSSFEEAKEYINNVLQPKYNWKMKGSFEKKFIALVERRYLI